MTEFWMGSKVDTWWQGFGLPWAPFSLPLLWNHSPFGALYTTILGPLYYLCM